MSLVFCSSFTFFSTPFFIGFSAFAFASAAVYRGRERGEGERVNFVFFFVVLIVLKASKSFFKTRLRSKGEKNKSQRQKKKKKKRQRNNTPLCFPLFSLTAFREKSSVLPSRVLSPLLPLLLSSLVGLEREYKTSVAVPASTLGKGQRAGPNDKEEQKEAKNVFVSRRKLRLYEREV